jgi:hypothetical protein
MSELWEQGRHPGQAEVHDPVELARERPGEPVAHVFTVDQLERVLLDWAAVVIDAIDPLAIDPGRDEAHAEIVEQAQAWASAGGPPA